MDPFDLVKTNVVAAPVIQLRRPRRRVVGHRGGIFERAAVFQIGGDTGRAERVIADLRADAGRERPAPHHRIRVGLRQRSRAQLVRPARDCAEQRTLRLIAQARLFKVRVEVGLERVMTGHLVPLAAFFAQTDPQASLLHIDIVDPHRERGADARERKHHQRDQRPVTQTDRRRHIDAVEQLARLGRIEHRRPALFRGVTGPAHRRSRVVRHDLASDEPVEQVADRGQPLLDGRCRRPLRLQFDPRGDMQRLYGRNRRYASTGAPGEEVAGRARIRAARVRIADRRREELKKADASPLAS